jgi:hypothetical protein
MMTDKERVAELEQTCVEHAQIEQELVAKLNELERTMVIGRGGASVSIDYQASPSDSQYKHVLFASNSLGDQCYVELTDAQLKQLAIIAMRAL